jgi:hypothetical protein
MLFIIINPYTFMENHLMKKILLLLFIFASISAVKASDTLTVRQVYNFNVGDTFDYIITTVDNDIGYYNTSFSRMVIVQKTLNVTQDTLTYIYADNTHKVYTNLDSIAVYQIDSNQGPYNVATFVDTTSFPGSISNSISANNLDGGTTTILTDSLGAIDIKTSMVANNPQLINTFETRLIYFSNGFRHWGSPYYDQYAYTHAGIAEMHLSKITISPNPTNGTFHLSLNEVNQGYQFILSDLLGKELLSHTISQSEISLDISNIASGLYTWRLVSENETVKTGKVVKQ